MPEAGGLRNLTPATARFVLFADNLRAALLKAPDRLLAFRSGFLAQGKAVSVGGEHLVFDEAHEFFRVALVDEAANYVS